MDQRKSLFLWMVCLICGLSSCASAEGHTDHDDAFDEILKTVNQTESLGLRHLTTLLETLGLHNCSNRTSHHHKCVTADSLFEFYNISNTSSLDETAFANIATVMVYCLLSHENRADGEYDDEPDRHDDRYVKQKVDVYDRLLERYDTEVFCEQILDQLLKDLNDSIGKQLNVSKIWDVSKPERPHLEKELNAVAFALKTDLNLHTS